MGLAAIGMLKEWRKPFKYENTIKGLKGWGLEMVYGQKPNIISEACVRLIVKGGDCRLCMVSDCINLNAHVYFNRVYNFDSSS